MPSLERVLRRRLRWQKKPLHPCRAKIGVSGTTLRHTAEVWSSARKRGARSPSASAVICRVSGNRLVAYEIEKRLEFVHAKFLGIDVGQQFIVRPQRADKSHISNYLFNIK